MTRRRWPRITRIAATTAVTVITAAAAVGCGGQHGGAQSRASARNTPPPVPGPLAPIGDYRKAVSAALHDHLHVWIEADLVRRWEEGPKWFHAAVARVSILASRPGVVGIKIADELGYNDGMDSPGKITQFLIAAAHALHAAAPHRLILVDMVLPQLGCIPGHQPAGSVEAGCAAQARSAYPQLALSAIDGYLRLHAIDVLDLSTGLLADGTYVTWGTTSDEAETAAWDEVDRRGWPNLVQLQARKALAHTGTYAGTQAQAAADVHLFVDIPLAAGARAVDIWTWNQIYNGAMYHLMNPGMRPNVLWLQLEQRRQAGDVLFTHMSPHSVELGLRADLAKIATVFTDVFLPAGTG